MNVQDLNGKSIEVTDLDLAIMQTDVYRNARHVDEGYKQLDNLLQAYWEDFHQKLVSLKEKGDGDG